MKKLFALGLGLVTALVFAGCSDKEPDNHYADALLSGHGAFVINEGSKFSNINGSLDWLQIDQYTQIRNVFKSVNNISLGGTPNDGVVSGDKLFVASADENKLWVINAYTGKLISDLTISSPRHLAADAANVYVSSYDGKVYAVSLKTLEIVATSQKVGQHLEGVAVRNGFVYVCNSVDDNFKTYYTNVVKLNTKLEKLKDITVSANPVEIVCGDDAVYVSCWGNYGDVPADVKRIDDNDQVTSLGVPASMMLATYNHRLYMTEPFANPATVTVYDYQTKKKTTLFTTDKLDAPCAMAIDPRNGDVFISSYSAGDNGYASYTTDGYVVRFNSKGDFVREYAVGVGPGTILFNN